VSLDTLKGGPAEAKRRRVISGTTAVKPWGFHFYAFRFILCADKMTPFARKVYQVVLRIPAGQVRTYKWVARKAGRPMAFRAVGQILKNNPYPLIIPCHRVVKTNHTLGGYIFGAKNKKILLDIEKEILQCLENRK